MHPDPAFRSDDRETVERFIGQIGIGTVFLSGPGGPAAVRTPVLVPQSGRVQFHISRHNALFGHVENTTGLITVDGPEGYISPRWYDNRDTVPTWNYVSVEILGTARRLSDAELEGFLHGLIELHETAYPGEPWRAEETSDPVWERLLKGIAGYEIEVSEYRSTVKLSQNKSVRERETIARGLEQANRPALAAAMREVRV